jgi:hypothetical protein
VNGHLSKKSHKVFISVNSGIRKGRKPETSGIEGLRVVQILKAASESLKKGGARVEIYSLVGQEPELFAEIPTQSGFAGP